MMKNIIAHKNLGLDARRASGSSCALRGQTTMVLIFLVLLLFAGTAIFLLTFAKNISQTDYMNFYVHNLLLTLMRSDTGYGDPNCKLVSDALSCAFFSPEYVCSGGAESLSCLELANSTATGYIERFSVVKKSYRYLLIVEPQGFTVLGLDGEPFKISIGDTGVAAGRQTKYTANEQMRKAMSSGVYNLNAKLIIMSK